MKILSFISFFLFAVFSFGQSGNIEFSKVLHDFGTISEHGGAVAYDFIFKNTGDVTISISNVKASCGCTVPIWTQSQVEPEEYGFVKITYHPKGRPGFFVKSIIVSASDGEFEFKRYLNIKGKVVSDNMEEVVGNFSYSEDENPGVSSKLINPYVQYFNSKNKKKHINDDKYEGFIEKLIAAASRDGFVNIRIGSSSSKFPIKGPLTKYEIAQKRAEDTKSELLISLLSKGINKNQVGFQEPEILIQGHEYGGKNENSKDYDLFEYVKITAIDYNTENEAEALKEFLKDSEISTTVQVMPEDIETLEKISKENQAPSEKEELDAIKASAEVIAKARHEADSLIASLKAKAESGEENESKRLKEQLTLQEEYVNLTRLEIQLLKEEMKVVKKSDSLSQQAIRELQLELNARRESEILAKQEAKEMQGEANTISLFEKEIDTLSAQLRDMEEAEGIAKLLIEELQAKLYVRETYDSIVQLKVAVLETELKLRREAGNAVNEKEAPTEQEANIKRLTSEIVFYKDSLVQANLKIEQLRAEINEIQNTDTQPLAETDKLNVALREKDEKLLLLGQEIAALESTLLSSQQADSLAQLEKTQLKNQLQSKEEELAQAKEETEKMKESLEASAEAGAGSAAETDKLNVALREKDEKILLLGQEIASLESTLLSTRQSDSLAQLENTQLKKQLLSKEEELAQAKEETEKMKESLAASSEDATEIEKLKSELSAKQQSGNLAREEADRLRQQLASLSVAENNSQAQIIKLTDELTDKEEALVQANNKIAGLENELITKQQEQTPNLEMENKIASLRKQLQDAVIFANEMKAMTLAEIKAKEKLEKELEVMKHSNSGFAAKNKTNGHVIYKVQVAISEKPLDIKKKFKGYDEISEYMADGKYKYAIGNKPNLQAANELKDELRKAGYEYAFVVAFKGNKKIPLKDALKYSSN